MIRKRSSVFWVIVALICVAAVIAFVVMTQQQNNKIDSFQTCKDAGGTIAESYPEQCLLGDKSFTNDQRSLENGGVELIGLAEQEALDQASRAGRTARVVSRDDKSLPVTMDFMPGRLNLHVKDDKVYKVQVEGEEQ